MKSRNLAKIVTLILSCALLIGAVVGISVVANESEGTTVAIKGANIAYEGAVQVVYYVDAQNLADGDVVKLVITNAEGEEITSKTNYVDYVKGDVTYKAFFSDGIAPKNLRQNVYAKAIVVDSEGAVKATTEVVAYSPYTYAMNRFGQSATPAQTELYKALLNYGAAVQAVLDPDTAGTEANPWADEYWDVTIDGTEYVRGNLFDGTYTADRFDAEGKSFTGWTNAEGATVVGWTTMTFKPGVATVLNSNYAEPHADLITFDGETLPGSFTSTAGLANQLPAEDYTGGYYYHNTAEGYLEVGRQNAQTNGSQFKFAPATPGVYAREYVFETDFMVKDWNMTLGGWTLKFDLWAAGSGNNAEIANSTLNGASAGEQFKLGGITADVGTWHHIKFVASIADDGTVTTTFYVDGKASDAGVQKALQNGDYKMLFAGIQFRDGGASEQNASNASYCFDNTACYVTGDPVSYELTLDANGGTTDPYTVTMGEAYTLPTPVNGDLPFVGWYIGDTLVEQSGTWNYVLYDSASKTYGKAPTLVAKWATPVNVTLDPNGGSVSSTSASVYTGQAYTLPTPERAGLVFGGWYDAEGNMYAAKGTWAGETDVTLTAKWYVEISGNSNDFSDANALGGISLGTSAGSVSDGKFVLNNTGWNAQVYFPMSSDKAVFSGNTAGTKYIFEMDFTYVGGAKLGTTTENYPAFIGFQNAADFAAYNGSQYSNGEYITPSKVDGGDGFADSVYMYGVQFMKGETYTVRFEQVVGNDQYVNVYVNGALAAAHKYNGVQASVDPTQVVGFQFTFRRVGNFTFDNVYCGLIAPSVETSFTLDAGYGALPEGAKTDWALMTGESYTLPTPTLDGFTFAGWSYGDAIIPVSGTWSAALDENATLVAKWILAELNITTTVTSASSNIVKPGGTATYDENGMTVAPKGWGSFQALPVATVTSPVAGSVYVFEADITYNASPVGARENWGWIGFQTTGGLGNEKMIQSFQLLWGPDGDSDGNADYITIMGQKFYADVKTRLRVEYTVGSKAAPELYINGAGVGKASNLANDNVASNGDETMVSFGTYFRAQTDIGSLTLTFNNVVCGVETSANESTVTLNANGGTLPEGVEDSFTLLTGMKLPELPTPNGGAYAFLGWYNGDALVNSGDVWTAGNATLVAKYLDTTTTTLEDATLANATKNFAAPNSNVNAVDAVGVRYVFTADYTYLGMSAFTGSGTAEDPFVKYATTQPQYVKIYTRKAGASAQNYAAVSTASGDIVNANGEVVATGGVLNDGLTLTKNEVFLSKLTWGGITYEIGQTYTLVITINMNNGGVPTVSVKATNKLTDEVKTGSISLKACDNIDYFRWEIRSAANACGSASNTFTTTDKFENVSWNVSRPIASAEITLDPNGGTLPEGAITGATVLPGATVALPTPTNGEYKFGGWYNGDTLVDNNYVATATATLTAKWLDVTTTECEDTTIAATGFKAYFFTHEGYTDDEVAVSGTKYTFTTDFTYAGLNSFSGTGTAEDPIVAQKQSGVYAYMGFTTVQSRPLYWQATAGGDFVTLDEETGEYVKCAEGGVFLEGFEGTDLSKVYFSEFTWAGMTFEIGKTYTVEFTTTIGTVTVTNGVVSATAPLNVKPTATDAEGNVQTGISASTDAKQPYYQIKGFMFETRGGSSVGKTDADNTKNVTYTLNCTFANSTIVEEVPVTDVAEIKATWIKARTTNPTTSKSTDKYFGLVKGAEYTIDAPAAVDGYTATWYLSNSSHVATASELPTTGTWNGTVGLTYAVAVYTEIPAEETPAEGEATE